MRLPGCIILLVVLRVAAVAQGGDGTVDESWPMYLGPDGTAVGRLERPWDPSKATKIWESADPIAPGRVVDGRRAGSDESKATPHSGGFASPVVADGRVYIFSYRPSGDVFDKRALSRMGISAADAVAAAKKNDPTGDALLVSEPNKWAIAADDIITCIDARTGKTLWRRVFKQAGVNWNMFSKGGPALTPAVAEGRVFAVGTLGAVYCLDARSGEPVWESSIGPRHEKMKGLRAASLKDGNAPRFNRDFLASPLVADGVVLCSDEAKFKVIRGDGDKWEYHYEARNGLIALDAATGKTLWSRPNSCSEVGPVIWRSGTKAYAIASDVEGMAALDLRTGHELWSIKEGHRAWWAASARGDYLLINPGSGDETGPTVCYRISHDKAERLWQLPAAQGRPIGNAAIVDNRAYINSRAAAALLCIDLPTGKLLGSFGVPVLNGEHDNAFVACYAGRVFTSNGRDQRGLLVADADPKAWSSSKPYTWPVQTTIGYIVPVVPAFAAGTVYIRTDKGLAAYALRP